MKKELRVSFGLKAKSYKLKASSGFTLLELTLVIAGIAIIAAISVTSLSGVNKQDALRTEAEKVLSLIAEARTKTLSAKEGSVYSVRFEERSAVLFKGASYSGGASGNKIQALNDAVKISAISLAGGGSEVVFKKITGATTQTGTVRISSVSDANASTTLTITATGMAYSN